MTKSSSMSSSSSSPENTNTAAGGGGGGGGGQVGGGVVPSQDLFRATSMISIWGPCRRVGDEYLSCVVTEGMGMCKPLRRTFEQCAQETSDHAIGMLDQLALQACSHIDQQNNNDDDNNNDRHKSVKDITIAKRNCAAQVLLRSQPQGPMQ